MTYSIEYAKHLAATGPLARVHPEQRIATAGLLPAERCRQLVVDRLVRARRGDFDGALQLRNEIEKIGICSARQRRADDCNGACTHDNASIHPGLVIILVILAVKAGRFALRARLLVLRSNHDAMP
jgi:hypothetical protein